MCSWEFFQISKAVLGQTAQTVHLQVKEEIALDSRESEAPNKDSLKLHTMLIQKRSEAVAAYRALMHFTRVHCVRAANRGSKCFVPPALEIDVGMREAVQNIVSKGERGPVQKMVPFGAQMSLNATAPGVIQGDQL